MDNLFVSIQNALRAIIVGTDFGCQSLIEHSPQLQVILLTLHSEDPLFQVDAAAAGAAAWFPHDLNHIELVIIVVAWMHGLEFLPRKQYLENAAPIELTARELDILQLMAENKTEQDIASQLVIAKDTARTHTKNILRKLQVNTRTEAVRRARRRGLI
jgi:DNA-binding NarL/FixJ family response regulator